MGRKGDVMKKNFKTIMLIALVLSVLACNGAAIVEPTSTPTSTSTKAPTKTAKPTSTPRPTSTKAPPTATPAPVGEVVTSKDYEVTVIKVRKLDTVYLDAVYHWAPAKGFLFAELGVKVTNLKSGTAKIPWQDIFIIEANGDKWYPGWGAFKAVDSGVDVRPTSLVFHEITDGNEMVEFTQDVYLRVIYHVKNNSPTKLLFRFGDAPLIEITIP